MMKQKFASSYFKIIIVILFLLILLFNIFFQFGYSKVIIISHQKTDKIYLMKKVKAGDIVNYKWIHSFEHIPWTEDYEIMNNGSLKLHTITVAGFGAGIPENKGNVTIKNELVYEENIEEDFKEINWINSNTALAYIGLNNKIIITGADLPHHEPLNLKIKERLYIWTRFH